MRLRAGETEAELDLDELISDLDEGDELTVNISAEPEEGSAELEGNTLTYTLTNEAAATDELEYTVTDSAGETATATITIEVTREDVDDTGMARNDTFRGFEGVVISALVEYNDGPGGTGLDDCVAIKTEADRNNPCTIDYDEVAVYEEGNIEKEVEIEVEGGKFNIFPALPNGVDYPAKFTFGYTLTQNGESDRATVTLLIEEEPALIVGTGRGSSYSGTDLAEGDIRLIKLKGTFGTVKLGKGEYMLGGGGDNRIQVDNEAEVIYTFSDKADDRGLNISTFELTDGNIVGGNMVVNEVIGANLSGDVRVEQLATNSVRFENSSGQVSLNNVTAGRTANKLEVVSLSNIQDVLLSSVKVRNIAVDGVGIALKDIGDARVYNSRIPLEGTINAEGAVGMRIANTNADAMKINVTGNKVELAGAATVAYIVEQLGTGNFSVLGGDNSALAETVARVACTSGGMRVNNGPYNCN